jgi:periplasmic protein TonB
MAHSWWSSPALMGSLLLSSSFHAVPVLQALRDLVEVRNYVHTARDRVHDFLWTNYEIEVEREKPKEQEKPKEPEPEPEPEPAPRPVVMPKVQAAAPKEAKEAPPAAAAQAAQTLTAKEDPNTPVDFSDFTMVQGNGSAYAGGVTAENGTSKDAVRDRGAKGGPTAGTGTKPGAPPGPAVAKDEGPDLSRAAQPANRAWSCSHLFPPEADADDVNVATVTIVVTVRPDGTPQSVKVLSDPGHGFGRAARTCALSQRYNAAFDRSGQATTGTTPPFPVRFER